MLDMILRTFKSSDFQHSGFQGDVGLDFSYEMDCSLAIGTCDFSLAQSLTMQNRK
jgi:hypothetical protein